VLALVPRCRLRRAVLLSLYLAACVGLSSAPAECPPTATDVQHAVQEPTPHILRSEVTLQTVAVQVTDKRGNRVRGLTAKDFTVREDGQRQQIAFFDAGAAPVTVAVLVDSAASMSRDSSVGAARQVAAEFARIARPGDDIYAMDFTDHNGPFEHLAAERLHNLGPLMVLSAGGSGAAVYDAIATAMCHLRDSRNPRQAIMVITDGDDQHSRLKLNQLIAAVGSQRAQLFLIGLHSKPMFPRFRDNPRVTLWGGHDIDSPGYVFYRLTKEAGAATFVLNSESGLQKALKAVSNVLESEYTLAYYPPNSSRKSRTIEIKVHRRGARILRSRFPVANPEAADRVHYVKGTCAVSPKFYPYPYESYVRNERGTTVYRDNFSDRNSGWPQHPDSHYVADGYELSTFDPTPQQPIDHYQADVIAADGPPGPAWVDFRISATARLFDPFRNWGGPSSALPFHPADGLVFRMSWRGYYALLVGPSARGLAFELIARKTSEYGGYSESVIVPWTTIAADPPSKAQLAVQDIGNQITLFIDGQRVGTARDNTFDGGYEGFIVAAPAHAIFSDFLLQEK
jgi:Ca-activated chloride channel homolog